MKRTDEQKTIDRIIEGFLSEDQAQKEYAAKLCGEEVYCDIGSSAAIGTVVPAHMYELDPDYLEPIADKVSPERLAELAGGAPPSQSEIDAYTRAVLDRYRGGSDDDDGTLGYWVQPLHHSDGRTIFGLFTLMSQEIGMEFDGLFRTVEEAIASLSDRGIAVSVDGWSSDPKEVPDSETHEPLPPPRRKGQC